MIGKHKSRANSFTLLHAGVLILALGVAPILSAELDAMRKTGGEDVTVRSKADAALHDPIRVKALIWWNCDADAQVEVDV